MIQIAIVEDDNNYIKILKSYVDKYMKEKGVTIVTEVFTDGENIVFDYRPQYDIIFLDIEMPKLDGITTAEKIREKDKDVIIIFITNIAQYAIKGYQVRARSYILKPINYYSFAFEMHEAIESLSKRIQDALLVTSENGLQKIPVADIYYLESRKHRMTIHTKSETIEIRETMKNMEQKLQPFYFVRCNVSYLVNLAYVSSIIGDMAEVGKDRVPISRQKRKAFIAAVTKYIGGGSDV